MNPPKKWKTAVLIWIAIYPTITLFFALFGEMLLKINPLPLRTLFITIIVVPLMVFVIIPLLQRVMIKWLQK
jgi:antibiotic biosynthesis monooxygenase (ABM) superfamily enzyme